MCHADWHAGLKTSSRDLLIKGFVCSRRSGDLNTGCLVWWRVCTSILVLLCMCVCVFIRMYGVRDGVRHQPLDQLSLIFHFLSTEVSVGCGVGCGVEGKGGREVRYGDYPVHFV